jgi:hypothetical protein
MNMAAEVQKMSTAVGLFDPKCFNLAELTSKSHSVPFVVSYMELALEIYVEKKLIFNAYLSSNHWIAVVILPKQERGLYLDSWKSLRTDISLLLLIINEQVLSFLTCGHYSSTNSAKYSNSSLTIVVSL